MKLDRADRTQRLDALAAQYALGTLSPRGAPPPRPDRPAGAGRRRRAPNVGASARRARRRHSPGHATGSCLDEGSAPNWVSLEWRSPEDAVRSGSWWQSLGLWRGLSFFGFAAALVLGLRLMAPAVEAPTPTIVAVLAGKDAKPVLVATVERGGRVLAVKAIGAIAIPPDRALELWALPEGKDPRSLGLVPAAGVVRIALPVPADDAFRGVPALAISLEPAGGSPTGKPTGPVLYIGGIERI